MKNTLNPVAGLYAEAMILYRRCNAVLRGIVRDELAALHHEMQVLLEPPYRHLLLRNGEGGYIVPHMIHAESMHKINMQLDPRDFLFKQLLRILHEVRRHRIVGEGNANLLCFLAYSIRQLRVVNERIAIWNNLHMLAAVIGYQEMASRMLISPDFMALSKL